MERGSAQHSPRVDDDLADESAALLHGSVAAGRDREDLEPEAPTIDETVPVPDPAGFDRPDEEPSHAELLARSELARWLLPSAFPADGTTLAAVAREQGAPEDLSAALDALDGPRRFDTVGELWGALGGTPEHRTATAPTPEPEVPPEPTRLDATAPIEIPPVGAEHPAEPVIRLITLGPRVAVATVRAVGRVLSRTAAAVLHSE